MRAKMIPGIAMAIFLASACHAKDFEHLTDYLNESISVVREHFDEVEIPSDWPESVSRQDVPSDGLTFSFGEGRYYGGLVGTITCAGTHQPIIGDLYGDSDAIDFIRYFNENGYFAEPVAAIGNGPSVDELSYVDPDMRYVFTIQVESMDAKPAMTAISTFVPSTYDEASKVRYVQTALTGMGFDPGMIDARMGAQTRQAIRDYQEHYGLEADGEMDQDLVQALYILWRDPALWSGKAKWYKDYLKYLIAGDYIYEDDNYVYSLIYVDDDKVPELVIKKVSSAHGSKVLTWHAGHISELSLARSGYLYGHKKNVFSDSAGITGGYWDLIYQIEDGEWKKIAEGRFNEDTKRLYELREQDPDARMPYLFTWDGETVGVHEYEDAFRSYLPKDQAKRASKEYYYWELEPILRNGKLDAKDKGQLYGYERAYDHQLELDLPMTQKSDVVQAGDARADLSWLLGKTLDNAGGIIDVEALEKRTDTYYYHADTSIDGRTYGYGLAIGEDGRIWSIMNDSIDQTFRILGLYHGMPVGDALDLLYGKGYHFVEAGSSNGVLQVWAGFENDSARVSFVTDQHAAHGSVTEEGQLDRDAFIDTVTLSMVDPVDDEATAEKNELVEKEGTAEIAGDSHGSVEGSPLLGSWKASQFLFTLAQVDFFEDGTMLLWVSGEEKSLWLNWYVDLSQEELDAGISAADKMEGTVVLYLDIEIDGERMEEMPVEYKFLSDDTISFMDMIFKRDLSSDTTWLPRPYSSMR